MFMVLPKNKRYLKRLGGNMLTAVDKALEFIPGYPQGRDFLAVVYKNSKTNDFDEFLLSIDKNLRGNDKIKERILKKFENPDSDAILAGIIDSAIFSKSKKCRLILGIIAAKHLKGEILDYEDMIIISAMKTLHDEELTLFFDVFSLKGIKETLHKSLRI